MRLKKQTKILLWWLIQLLPVLMILALTFVQPIEVVQSIVGDGTQFGLFGSFFVDFLQFFRTNLPWLVLLLCSLVDWALTVTVVRIVYETFALFTTWIYGLFDGFKKGRESRE